MRSNTRFDIPTDIRSLFMIERGAAVWCGEDDLVRSYSFMTRSSPWMTAEGMK